MSVLRFRPALWLALLTAALHLSANGQYGYHRDELYFIICGQSPDWGYVDQPPLVPLLAALVHALFPNSLAMFRLIPALAHAGTVALTAETARKLGGGTWAQLLAGLAAFFCPILLAFGTIFYTDSFQPIAWLFCAYALIGIVRDGDERWWLPMGLVIGLACMAKFRAVKSSAATVRAPARNSTIQGCRALAATVRPINEVRVDTFPLNDRVAERPPLARRS